ncbi:CMRF35-like molecule 8 isoform X1 [Callospermophilus lateralis]|uniref:CMRF35-like molecule 8 isoform X1 n=1 Tax=Callospermophilus lateralis TaxID=76772 RepID=UPI004053A7BA
MAWPPLALLLLWLPDCVPLSGPSKVTGIVGGSLMVQCHYGEGFKDDNKLWCKKSVFYCYDIVKTRGSEGEMRSGRVSISDHPANLSFTVTMERLTLEDAGSYECQVDTPWYEGFDQFFKVEVTVQPDLTPATSGTLTSVTAAKTLTTTSRAQAALSTSLATESATPGPSSQDLDQGQRPGECGSVVECPRGCSLYSDRAPAPRSPPRGPPALRRLPLLLLLLSLLLLLLVGASLLVWRRLQKRVKAGERSELSQTLRQAAGHSEPYYANLKLQTWSLQEEPVPPRQAEVEYSMLAFPREEPHCSSVVFDSPRPDSSASGAPSQRPPEEVPEYSVIRKPRAKEG